MSDKTNRKPIFDPQNLAMEWIVRERAGDSDGMAELYETGAVLDTGDGQLAVGQKAIRAFFAQLVATGIKFEPGEQRPAIISGDLALTSTVLPGGGVTAEVARRQPDGTWLWVIDQPSVSLMPKP